MHSHKHVQVPILTLHSLRNTNVIDFIFDLPETIYAYISIWTDIFKEVLSLYKWDNILNSFLKPVSLTKKNVGFIHNMYRFTNLLKNYYDWSFIWIIDHLFNQYPIFKCLLWRYIWDFLPQGSITDWGSQLLHPEIRCYSSTKTVLPMDCTQLVIECGRDTKAGPFLADTGIHWCVTLAWVLPNNFAVHFSDLH